MADKYIIIFKNKTNGFMNLENINNLADIFELNPILKNKIGFILENEENKENNQALMQMYNTLIGFDIFKASYQENSLLIYKHLNKLQLKKELITQNITINDYLKDKYDNHNLKKYEITEDIYKNIFMIIKEIIKWQY